MPAAKKKAPIELQLDEANTDNPIPYQEEGATMNASIPEIAVNFDINTGHARVQIQSEADYWRDYDQPYADEVTEKGDLVRLTDNSEAHILLSPAEALSVAAALQAVAIHLMERRPREIHRKTEPGAPGFEESI